MLMANPKNLCGAGGEKWLILNGNFFFPCRNKQTKNLKKIHFGNADLKQNVKMFH